MIKFIRFILLSGILLLTTTAHASYTMTELEGTPLEVPDIVNTVAWDGLDTDFPNDDDKQLVSIGFPFQFDNFNYEFVTIFTNGILKFLPADRMHRDYINESLPTDEGDGFIAVYWDDLVDDANSSVTYGNLGTAPNRKFVVNWTNVRSYFNNLRYDFQVVLYENGDIRYRYNNNTSNGQSATIGLEINDSDSIEYSFNEVSVEVSFDLFFRNDLLSLPAPILQYRLDEVGWDGSIDEVIDSGPNALHGRSFSGADTRNVSPALGANIGTCNYGEFDGQNDYVEVNDNALLDLSNNFAVGVWVKIDSIPTSGLKTIVSKDENYEFHVNSDGKIYWWWNTEILGIVRTLTSDTSIVAGVWTHIVISFSTVTQNIFINGVAAGEEIYPEGALTNSDPLQIGADQNSSSRYFNGDIDEVNIFDQALSAAQARELMEATRPCPSLNLCVGSFPDGLNSHSGGSIIFEQDAQLFFSPNDILSAGSVSLDGSSSQRSCVSVECQASGLAVEATTPAAFPNTSINTADVIVNDNNTGDVGSGENNYDNVLLGNNATLNVLAGYSDYYIDNLSFGTNGELNLVAGTYWINNFSAGRGLDINISGGTARVYINNNLFLPRDAIINSPATASQGDASQLFLYAYNNINTGIDITFSGVIYAAGNIELDNTSNYYGAITGADISIGNETNVFFNPAATANLNYGDLCQSASCALGSFNITQPAYALACPGTRTKISIQAMCDDGTSIKDDYMGSVGISSNENSLSEFYTSLTSTPTINSISFDGTELGAKDVFLFHQNENSALQVIATDTVESVTSTSSNATDFRTEGFAITDPDTFTCGGSTSMSLTAIGEDDTGLACQTLTGFTGAKDLKAWYEVNLNSTPGAETVSTNLLIEGQGINAQSEPTANNIGLTFINGVADFSIAYENAGQILGVSFKHDDAPYDGSVPDVSSADLSGSTGSFIASPEKISLVVDTANGVCGSADATCSKLVSAGSPFLVTAQAQCIGSTLADDYQGSIELLHSLVAPLPGALGTLGVSAATITALDGGEIQITQSISEVGVFDLIAADDDYFGEIIPTFVLSNVGRFYPSHYAMTSSSTTNSCGVFSYMDQTDNEIDISYTVQAENFGGGITLNYDGDFAKADVSVTAENDNDGGAYQARLSGFNSTSWNNGEYLYSDGGSFLRATSGLPDGPYQDLQLGVQLSDNDGSVSGLTGLNMRAGTDTDCSVIGDCDAAWIGNNLDLRFGQLKLSNAFGPEAFALDMIVRTEYYDGTGFILNTDDSCTNLFTTNPPLAPVDLSWTDNLSVGETTPTLTSDIASGVGVISFSAAELGNEGSVIFKYDTVTDKPWLNTENDDDADYADNPFGKITFGQFRGNDRMIYWREIVR